MLAELVQFHLGEELGMVVVGLRGRGMVVLVGFVWLLRRSVVVSPKRSFARLGV